MNKSILALLVILNCLASFGQSGSNQPGSPQLQGTSLQLLLQNPPAPVPLSSISATMLDNPGSSTYCYFVVARFAIGNAQPQGPVCITNGASTLSSGNRVTWGSVAGAVSYDVLRTSTLAVPSGACGCAVATANTSFTVTDTGSLSSYTVSNFSGDFSFTQQDTQCSSNLAGLSVSADGGSPLITVTSDGVLHQGNCTGPPITGGGGPGSPNLSLQYNNGGTFGGIPVFLWNGSLDQIQCFGDPNCAIQMGIAVGGQSNSRLTPGAIQTFDSGGSPANLTSGTGLGAGSAPGTVIAASSPGDGAAKGNMRALVATAGPNTGDTAVTVRDIQLSTQNVSNIGSMFGIDCDAGLAGGISASACVNINDQGTGGNAYAIRVLGGKSWFTGIEANIRQVSSNTNQTINDYTLDCNASGGAVTITGLAGPPPGMLFQIKKVDSTNNPCIFAGNTNSIDGNTSFSMSAPFQSAIFAYNSGQSNWDIVAQQLQPVQLMNGTNVTEVTVNASTTSPQTLQTACNNTPCFLAGAINAVGKTFDAEAWGAFTPLNTIETIGICLNIGAGSACVPTFVATSTGGSYEVKFTCAVTASGATGSARCGLSVAVQNAIPNANGGFFNVTGIDLTAAISPTFTISFGTASTANVGSSNLATLHQEN